MRTDKCNSVSCNCGVAAREGNDVIVVDFCKGAVQTARFASQGIPANGTQLLRDGIGKNFIVSIRFPENTPFVILVIFLSIVKTACLLLSGSNIHNPNFVIQFLKGHPIGI